MAEEKKLLLKQASHGKTSSDRNGIGAVRSFITRKREDGEDKSS